MLGKAGSHAVCGVLLEGVLLLWRGLGKQQLLGPILGSPLSRFLGGLVGPPGHMTGLMDASAEDLILFSSVRDLVDSQ